LQNKKDRLGLIVLEKEFFSTFLGAWLVWNSNPFANPLAAP
jgi:hypothetical protein